MMASFAALHNDYDDDDDDDDEEESDQPQEESDAAAVPPSTLTAAASEQEEEEEEDDDDGDSESDDGELPLATPYPWQQDDYELTLHHEPKKRKPVGTGMIFAKRLLLESSEGDPSTPSTNTHPEANVLSDPAKIILKHLLREYTKTNEDSSEEEESDEEEEEEEDEEDTEAEGLSKRKRLPGPRLYMPVSYTNAVLFPAILEQVDITHPLNVTTRQIIRTCALKIPPGAPPAAMDAKEFICCALFLLSSEWTSPDPTQIPSLPLIRSTAAPGNARDLEKRTYEKVGDWTVSGLPLRELERLFFESPSSGSQLQWISRIRFCPRTRGGGSESTLLLKGTIPARLAGKKSTGSTPGPKPKKKKKSPENNATQGVNLNPQQQGKQLPFHPFGNNSE